MSTERYQPSLVQVFRAVVAHTVAVAAGVGSLGFYRQLQETFDLNLTVCTLLVIPTAL